MRMEMVDGSREDFDVPPVGCTATEKQALFCPTSLMMALEGKVKARFKDVPNLPPSCALCGHYEGPLPDNENVRTLRREMGKMAQVVAQRVSQREDLR